MHAYAASYLAGVLLALGLHAPPAAPAALGLLVLAGALAPFMRLPAILVAGFAWGALAAGAALDNRLKPELENATVALGGSVAAFATAREHTVHFDFRPRQTIRGRFVSLPARIAVTWPRAPAVPAAGAWCELHLRLRRPHGLANPGSSDRERGFALRGVGATAWVVAHPGNVCADIAPAWTLERVRGAISAAIAEAVVNGEAGAVIRALAVADRSGLTSGQWEVMRATGTGHLLAISGLHVALVAGWSFFVLRYAAACVLARAQDRAAVRIAWCGALAAACIYAALAGFGVPTRRAAVMVAVAAAAALRGRRALSSANLALALVVVVTLDPLATLSGGFWMSFCAAAVLVCMSLGRRRPPRGLGGAWRRHVALACGIAPLTALLFGEISLTAPLANLLAVPYCAAFVVPFTLAGLVSLPVSGTAAALLWDLAARAWALPWPLLEVLARVVPPADVAARLTIGGAALCVAGLALLALPRGVPGRLLGLGLLGAVALPRQAPLAPGEFRLGVLDVGQGLAVVVATRSHALLYDTGPLWWGSGRNAGAVVVVPALRALGIARLDLVVVSHADADHASGLGSVLGAVPVERVLLAERGSPGGPGPAAGLCRAPSAWTWDGVRFEILQPLPGDTGTRNDRSCVIAIAGAGGRALLPGDIEAEGEARLLARHGAALEADVIVVPHHGSATSSGEAFVRAVDPDWALVSTGYRNRFGFPHPEVVARYRAAGAEVLDTAYAGMIGVTAGRTAVSVRAHRFGRTGFWNGPAP